MENSKLGYYVEFLARNLEHHSYHYPEDNSDLRAVFEYAFKCWINDTSIHGYNVICLQTRKIAPHPDYDPDDF